MLSGGNRNVIGRTIVVRPVVVVEGRDGEEKLGTKSVDPGKIHNGIRLVVAITKIEAGVLPRQLAIGQSILDIIGIGIVGNLVIVLAQRSDEAQLIGWIDVKDE